MANISKQKLAELLRAKEKLNALENGGVDNWEWYDKSLEEWHKNNDLIESREELLNELSEVFGECAYEPSERGAGIAFNDDLMEAAMNVLERHGVTFTKNKVIRILLEMTW